MAETHRDEIAKLEALYASNPAGRVFTHLAEAYRKAGDLTRAREILVEGLERHPDYPSAHVVLGRVLVDRGEREEAAVAFRKVLELDRHNLVALRNLGSLAVEAGRFEEARHYFGELIQVDPGDLEIAERLDSLPEDAQAATPSVGEEADEPEAEEVGAGPEIEAGVELEEEVHREVEPATGEGEPLPGGQASRLDAWVESLSVLGMEPEPGESRGSRGEEPKGESVEAELPPLAEPEAEAMGVGPGVEAPSEPEGRGEAVPEPAEPVETGLEAAILEAEAEALYPGEAFLDAASPERNSRIEIREDVVDEETGVGAAAAEPGEPGAAAGGEPIEPSAETGPSDTAPATPVEVELESAWWGDPEIHGTVPDPVEWVSQEDWERIAAYGAWSGAAQEEESVEAAPELEPEWGEIGQDEDADEVATETLAEVYAAQGFRTEAADIYRKLLRRRPEDPRLLSRLAALEHEQAPPPAEAGYEAEAEEPATGDVWLEPAEPSWPGTADTVVAGPTPYAWVETGGTQEAEEGETIGHHLRGLLAWRPEAGPEPLLLLEEVAEEPSQPVVPGAVPPRVDLAGPAPTTGDPGDDDLEMFRSWLKSLRK